MKIRLDMTPAIRRGIFFQLSRSTGPSASAQRDATVDLVAGRVLWVANALKLPCNDLGLPFGIEGDAQDRSTLVAQEHQDRDRLLAVIVASTKGLDQDIRSCVALRTRPTHDFLLRLSWDYSPVPLAWHLGDSVRAGGSPALV